jgi:hypothetical protein
MKKIKTLIMDQDQGRYLVVYCTNHKFGKLIDIDDITDEFDTEGNLRLLATYLQICSKGVFKRTSCNCSLHGVIDIDSGILTVDPQYGIPHDYIYTKGWKLKYYMRSMSKKDKHYEELKNYFSCKF